MAGILYISDDTRFVESYCSVMDKYSTVNNSTKIVVYQSESGRTGIDVDSAGEKLAYLLLADTHICSSSGEVTTFSKTDKSFNLDVFSFLAKGGRNPITFGFSSSAMQELSNELSKYVAEAKRNELRARYGKSVDNLSKPILLNLFSEDAKEYYTAIEWLLETCGRVMLWPTYDDGFGMHMISIDHDQNQYLKEIATQWADDCGCKVDFSVEREKIPAW